MSVKLKETIIMTASYYNLALKAEVLNLYVEDLKDLEPDQVIKAYHTYRRDPKNRTMPLPAHIRDLINPVVTPIADGREVLERIKYAITKFGYASGKLAHEYIGDIGWRAVQRSGGWYAVCESDIHINAARQAQMRDSITDQIQYGSKLGTSQIFQALPYKQTNHEDSEAQRNIEIESEKTKQLNELMEKFNLKTDLLRQGAK